LLTTPRQFSLSRSVILYDVTNSHFEGICASNRNAKNEKKRVYQVLGIDCEAAFPTKKTEIPA
jgi:hypothetical protein